MSTSSSPDRSPRGVESFKKRIQENREYDANASWQEWLRHRYLKFWYGLGSLILDGMVVGLILQATVLSQVWPIVAAAAAAIALVYLELLGLRRFWPRKKAA